MAGGQVVEFGGYRFTVTPQSALRRLLHDFLPYWQASKPKFMLTIEMPSDAPHPTQTRIHWFLQFSDGQRSGHTLDLQDAELGDPPHTFTVGDRLLSCSGDTILAIPVPDLHDPAAKHCHVLYSFHTTPKTWLFLTVVVALLTALLSALGALLIAGAD